MAGLGGWQLLMQCGFCPGRASVTAVPDEWWQVIHGSRRTGTSTVGVAELEGLVMGATGGQEA